MIDRQQTASSRGLAVAASDPLSTPRTAGRLNLLTLAHKLAASGVVTAQQLATVSKTTPCCTAQDARPASGAYQSTATESDRQGFDEMSVRRSKGSLVFATPRWVKRGEGASCFRFSCPVSQSQGFSGVTAHSQEHQKNHARS